MQFSRLACVGWSAVLLLVGLAQGEDRPASDDVRVMSFNIRYGTAKDGENHWDRRREFLVETIVVTGDFNTDEGSEPYLALFKSVDQQESLVVDTYRAKHPTRDPSEGTFSNFRADATKGARIDWIGASRDWQVVEATIDRTARDGRTPSDHFPITALLRASKPDQPQSPPAEESALWTGKTFDVDTVLDVVYHQGDADDERKHKLDVFLPKGHQDFPVLFFIHGGAWVSGDRKLYSLFGHTFAKCGIGTVVISYRLSPKVQHPEHIKDVARAFAWTHKNIGKYGGRNDQIFITGQSAGGHLAALLATNDEYLRAEGHTLKDIKGAIPISGIYTFRGGFGERVIGKGQEAADSASPLKHVSGKEPPFLILYADRDFATCGTMSRELCRQLQASSATAEVKEIKERNHISIMLKLMLSDTDATAQELLKFVAQYAGIKLVPR